MGAHASSNSSRSGGANSHGAGGGAGAGAGASAGAGAAGAQAHARRQHSVSGAPGNPSTGASNQFDGTATVGGGGTASAAAQTGAAAQPLAQGPGRLAGGARPSLSERFALAVTGHRPSASSVGQDGQGHGHGPHPHAHAMNIPQVIHVAGEAAAHGVWCYVKAKTRQHNTNRITRRTAWFDAKPGSVMTIGRQAGCDLVLEDDRCAEVNARITPGTTDGTVLVHADARMYRLIGTALKPKNQPCPLQLGSVIKVGSVSLEVTAMCTEKSEDFTERFGVELGSGSAPGSAPASASASASASAPSDAALVDPAAAQTQAQTQTQTQAQARSARSPTSRDSKGGEGTDDEGGAGGGNQSDGGDSDAGGDEDVVVPPIQLPPMDEDMPAEICYICWGGPDEPVPLEDLNMVRKKGERRSAAEVRAKAGELPASLKSAPNPLIRNPCGKCSGSSKYVHLQCILTWIKSSGSGHCSICGGALPQHFASPPPNIELKVVRHRRGQSWQGARRFRLSFAEKDTAVIGREPDSDVRLHDRSVCPSHARIKFDAATKQFFIQDCASAAGTYIQLVGHMELSSDAEASYFKIGRTTLSVRLSHRRNSIRSYLTGLTGGPGGR